MTMSLEEHLLAVCIDRTLPFNKSIAMSKIADTVSEFLIRLWFISGQKGNEFKKCQIATLSCNYVAVFPF